MFRRVQRFVMPRKGTRLKLGERAFSAAAPQAWNRLPAELKTMRSTPAFKRALKTFLFRTAYLESFYFISSSKQPYCSCTDSVMRRRSIYRQRTKSVIVLYCFDTDARLSWGNFLLKEKMYPSWDLNPVHPEFQARGFVSRPVLITSFSEKCLGMSYAIQMLS